METSYYTLPPLREELSLHRGPILATGERSHTLEDPVRNQFFRIDWTTYEVLCRWYLGNPDDIVTSLRADTALEPVRDDVDAVLAFLSENQLLRPDPLGSAKALAERYRAANGTWFTRLLHHYLFFRVPLVHPDRWLGRLGPLFQVFVTTRFAWITLASLLVGATLVWRQWDSFQSTLSGSFTPGGLLAYGLALVAVKCAHELGHALTAKRHGCRVPTMGLAFLVLWPVPYTDTNDVWRLDNRRWRQQVAMAGVATELVIAIWATLAWALLPDGLLRQIAFTLATTTWITTLLVNASPFMRFDGYFVLSDWLDMPNLHSRAFALARWDLRERLFGLGAAVPEYFTQRRHIGLIFFAWAVWLYRITVFIGIALLVYHFFIKLIGIFLFCIEMSWFVVRPIVNEVNVWKTLWPRIRKQRHAWKTTLAIVVLTILFIVPWPSRIETTAVLRPVELYPIYAPGASQIAATPISDGQYVSKGTELIKFAAAENTSKIVAAQARAEQLRAQLNAAGFDVEQRARTIVIREELSTVEAQLDALHEAAAKYRPQAPFSGTLRYVDPDLRANTWVARNDRIALLVGDSRTEAIAYLDEDSVGRVSIGDRAIFYLDNRSGPAISMSVAYIDRDATRSLPDGTWVAQYGGTVAAREQRGVWYAEKALYRVTFRVEEQAQDLTGRKWRGRASIVARWESPGLRVARSAISIFWREAGF